MLASFAPEGTRIILVAGRNAPHFRETVESSGDTVLLVDDPSCTDGDSSWSLCCGLKALDNVRYDRIDILEADIILTQEALQHYEATVKLPKFAILDKECGDADDKISFDEQAGHYVISKTGDPNSSLGKYLGVTSIPGQLKSTLIELAERNRNAPYVATVSTLLTKEACPVILGEQHGTEIDTGEDYQRVLSSHEFCRPIPSLSRRFPRFHLDGFTQRWIGVYDVMGARMAQAAGFDGVWLGSFQMALSQGREDDSSYDPLNALGLAREIRSRGYLGAVVLDATHGWESSTEAEEAIGRCVDAGIDAVVIDDNPQTRQCSLYSRNDYNLTSPEEFARRIRLAAEAADSRLGIIARTETIVQEERDTTRNRACLAREAGASAFIPHYVGRSESELEMALGKEPWPLPIVLIPTGLLKTPIEQFHQLGCRAIVYANIDLRLRIGVLAEAYRSLSSEAKLSEEVDSLLCSPEEARDLAAGINVLK